MSAETLRERALREAVQRWEHAAWCHTTTAGTKCNCDADEMRDEFVSGAEWILAVVADDTIEIARVLAQVLLDHQPGDGYPWDDRDDERRVACWCGDLTPSEFFGWRLREWHRKHVAAHQAAAVAAYLAGDAQ